MHYRSRVTIDPCIPTYNAGTGGGCSHSLRGRSRTTTDPPSHPYTAGAEHIELSPIRLALLAPSGRSAVRCSTSCMEGDLHPTRSCLGGGEGRTHLFLAFVSQPLTTYPFRDGAPFLLLTETPPTFGRSFRGFHIPVVHRNFLLVLSPSCFAPCGHHLSPRIAIASSLLF